MLIDSNLMSSSFLWVVNLFCIFLLSWFALRAHWQQIFEVPERQHLLLGSTFFLVIFWLMHFELVKGLWIHPLIVTSVALIVGFRFSVIVCALATIGYLLFSGLPLSNFGTHFLINGVVPAAFIVYLSRWVRSKEPGNLFFYTLGVGFIGGALTIPLVAVFSYLIIWGFDITLFRINDDFKYQWILLGMFPEAFINGVIVSSITVFFPNWMRTFDEDYFLSK